jgi:hypothetical protein
VCVCVRIMNRRSELIIWLIGCFTYGTLMLAINDLKLVLKPQGLTLPEVFAEWVAVIVVFGFFVVMLYDSAYLDERTFLLYLIIMSFIVNPLVDSVVTDTRALFLTGPVDSVILLVECALAVVLVTWTLSFVWKHGNETSTFNRSTETKTSHPPSHVDQALRHFLQSSSSSSCASKVDSAAPLR